MALRSQDIPSADNAGALNKRYATVRAQSLAIAAPLSAEDCAIQSMPSVSPTKWHLAHTSWFFEQFILVERLPGYRVFHPRYEYLFNSYYYTKGQMHPRPERGLLSRPGLDEIRDYRTHVDTAMQTLLAQAPSDELTCLIELGLQHEQQHQELMLTDIKHVFSVNPLQPAYLEGSLAPADEPPPLSFVDFPGGIREIGARGNGFCFDNETPRHAVLLAPYRLANRLVTNAEYREFIAADGYHDSRLWLADGWAWLQAEAVERPLYWSADLRQEFTLHGRQPLDPARPVCHLSYYEADAYARWAGARLPTEAEWECAAAALPVAGQCSDPAALHPGAAIGAAGPGNGRPQLLQVFGDCWEWTASAYSPYPGFKPLAGSLGEYNGKFMCNQLVCRGGSCVTPPGHVRASYRNFFYPQERWQFFGLRLARDAGP